MGTDAPRTRRHWGLTFLIGLLVTVLVLGIAGAGLGWWTVQRSFPTTSGNVDVPGLTAAVTVYRDDAGIPQLVAETDHDLFFAQGYVHAQDRFWEMDFRRHVTSGRLAELFGESQVGTDAFIRTLDWRGVAEQEYELLDESSRAHYDAYAEGVNAYLAERDGAGLSLEYAVLGLQNPGYSPEPWSPADSIAWLKAMAWDLRSNLGDEIDRALLASVLPPEEVARLHPDYAWDAKPTILDGPVAAPAAADMQPLEVQSPDASAALDADGYADALSSLSAMLDEVPTLLGPEGSDIGSNSWVISGALTESGLPLLANDTHLGPAMPSIWAQMGLHCLEVSAECAYDVSGFTFAGLPGVIIGHNDRIAWGLSNLGPDVADLYLERVDGDAYELDGAMVPLTLRKETIEVAGGEPVEITVRSTAHGPIVTDIDADFKRLATEYPAASGQSEGEYEVSLQWTALSPGNTPQAILALDRARDWNGFRAAAALFDVPSQNLVYADVDGNIGYQAPGRIPVRTSGDGTVPLPGWTSENRWAGTIPFDQLPSVLNPPSGYLVTANNPLVASGEPMLTKDWDMGYRAETIDRLLGERIAAGEKLTADSLAEIQLDTSDPNAAAFLPVIASLELSGDAARGAELLDGWDAVADVDSAEAAYFSVFWKTLLDEMFGELPDGTRPKGGDRWFSVVDTLLTEPDARWWSNEEAGVAGRDAMIARALELAWSEAETRMGSDSDSWRWGRLHTLTLTNASFGESGIAPIEWLFNRGPYELGGGSSIVNAIGWDASIGYGVHWVPSMRLIVDLGDADASRWVNLTGASGHAFHPNYADQTPLWQRGETRPWPSTLQAIRDTARDTLQLRP
ncbi:penicillin acylase family protein [Agromyces sp. ISL-38]|uniref:penicillin acylase family protein n=1 Tax=Agromyces sp. ISL-38 TaxID=2819107 RepID=UPI001BEC279D|nr:penicillin acylase family protein [Agromyces sp. ISL-38]MBT2498903.1 penicillin acylase family protein [Agromyces sp. ISL-38]MBT2516411.1 penicillin acylase family protein [Streptomyces sp. ISL-90]